MAGFTESFLHKKLEDLNDTQQSIQTLSLWLIHHRKHYELVVRTWVKELAKADEPRRLTLMHLANDVIQNSRRKGPEYNKEFGSALKRAFKILSSGKLSERTIQKIDRLLNIWEERAVYEKKAVEEYRRLFHRKEAAPESKTAEAPPAAKKAKLDSSKIAEVEVDGTKELHVTLSPSADAGDPPEAEELIKALMDLENSASVDVAVREKISKLPPEVSEVKLLSKIEDKENALRLADRVNDAVELLTDYNNRLAQEMEYRKKVTQMLKDFITSQKELLAQAEGRLEEYKDKLIKVEQVRHEVISHLSNLPDLHTLPDISKRGLTPLPSAGDLFT